MKYCFGGFLHIIHITHTTDVFIYFWHMRSYTAIIMQIICILTNVIDKTYAISFIRRSRGFFKDSL
jgi:hypothetical protein